MYSMVEGGVKRGVGGGMKEINTRKEEERTYRQKAMILEEGGGGWATSRAKLFWAVKLGNYLIFEE